VLTTNSLSLARSSFFFYSSTHHPHLHSFPTRRSSDLEIVDRRIATTRERFTAVFWGRPRMRILLEASTESEWVAQHLETLGHERSEEHTSELQSRGHLVCRLLLEKKKKTEKARHS